jgi:tRNA-dihydrouridine synthase A
MKSGVKIPVTVKHRIGVDEQDDYQDLAQFVKIVAEAGCDRFTVHARKAWLKGLSPKENRTIPPLCYDLVYRLKEDCPHLCIEINGGITQLEAVQKHLQLVDAVMIGRAAYDNPYLLAQVDREIYGNPSGPLTRHQVVQKMLPYIEAKLSAGVRLNSVSRHLLNLFTHTPGSRAWKRHITENAHLPGADVSVITQALACVPHYALQNI